MFETGQPFSRPSMFWGGLFLGWLSLGFLVGSDNKYGDSRETGNSFYTSLKPWNR